MSFGASWTPDLCSKPEYVALVNGPSGMTLEKKKNLIMMKSIYQ